MAAFGGGHMLPTTMLLRAYAADELMPRHYADISLMPRRRAD